MKVLVTGAKGQLGYDVVGQLTARHMDCKGIDIDTCDLTDPAQTLDTILTYRPDCVVHCAAYTAVDKAEEEAELCRRINVEGTRNVAAACKQLNAKMVYISTDYVFSGEGTQPFDVDDPKGPLSVYGKTKLAGEQAVEELVSRHFIVRISWAFGINGRNFVKTMLKLGRERETITVVNDQIGSPTYTEDLARLLLDMLQSERYGTYHATNEGYCSWFEFAQSCMELAHLPCKVIPVSTAEYNAAAKRPLNSRLSKRALTDAGFAPLPPWRDALKRYIAACEAQTDTSK